jgi:superfamily I DNA/RNA helicase
MARSAWGLEAPPTTADARADVRALQAAARTLDELEIFGRDGEPLSREDVIAALERTMVRPAAVGETGYVAVLDYSRVRTRLFDVVFLLGLEEGSFPRRDRPSPFLDDDTRRDLGGRLERVDSVERDRYLFYTACTRASRRIVLVREAATDEGVPREPSPFWNDVRALFDLTSEPMDLTTFMLAPHPRPVRDRGERDAVRRRVRPFRTEHRERAGGRRRSA